MVANVMHSRMSHVQIAQDNFFTLKGPDPSYLVLNISNILPINNWDMAQNVILKGHDLERSRSYVKTNGTNIKAFSEATLC